MARSEQSKQPTDGPRRPRPRTRRVWWWVNVLGSVVLALVAARVIVHYAMAEVPMPDEVKLASTSVVYDRHGKLIATYRDEVTRFIIDTTKLPDHVRDAVVAAEDRDFYAHEGVSLGGIIRAAWKNVTSGGVVQGGSTITQQYVKNAVLEDPSRTIERKLRESILAIKLERRYSKSEILDFYLNTVYFGRGAYGIEAAARTYFSKHAQELTVSESAYLAGLIPAPASYQERQSGLERRQHVLTAMRDEGFIDGSGFRKADSAKLRLRRSPQLLAKHQPAAYFLEWLRKDFLYPRFGECLYRCGLKIYTTIDMAMQRNAEESIASVLDRKGDPAAALVSVTPSGEVRAMVGGRDFTSVKAARGFNFATDGKRQAGSAFKPFTLLAAIQDDISPTSRFSGESPKRIEDASCADPEKGLWEPENYGAASYGTLDLRSATANSVNTVFAELVSEVGAQDVADLVRRFGFTGSEADGSIDPNCSLALGTLDVSVLEMARAYAGFAARGRLPDITPIRHIENRAGRCVLGYGTPKKMGCRKTIGTDGRQVVEADSADVLTDVLTGVVEEGTATTAQIGRPVAGKTGTTQDNRDAWFAGYTPQIATVVWMGYPVEKGRDKRFGTGDDISPLMHYCGIPAKCRPVHGIEVTGGSFPATIWATFMRAVLEGVEIAYFPEPSDMPDIVLNPPPPPAPEPAPKEKGKPDESDGGGHGKDKKDGLLGDD